MLKQIFNLIVKERTEKGGRIVINTGAVDRMDDRVRPNGAKIANYLKNPVVQWGHNYHDPWATIGSTTKLEITDEGIVAEFELREPANDSDPQNIILALWKQGLVRAASVGFNPLASEPNEDGGRDFVSWELLEWSLVPIPANQEALALAYKAIGGGNESGKTVAKQAKDVNKTISVTPAELAEYRKAKALTSQHQPVIKEYRKRMVQLRNMFGVPITTDELKQIDMVFGKAIKVLRVVKTGKPVNGKSDAATPQRKHAATPTVQKGLTEKQVAQLTTEVINELNQQLGG